MKVPGPDDWLLQQLAQYARDACMAYLVLAVLWGSPRLGCALASSTYFRLAPQRNWRCLPGDNKSVTLHNITLHYIT